MSDDIIITVFFACKFMGCQPIEYHANLLVDGFRCHRLWRRIVLPGPTCVFTCENFTWLELGQNYPLWDHELGRKPATWQRLALLHSWAALQRRQPVHPRRPLSRRQPNQRRTNWASLGVGPVRKCHHKFTISSVSSILQPLKKSSMLFFFANGSLAVRVFVYLGWDHFVFIDDDLRHSQ